MFGLWRRFLKIATAANSKIYLLTGGRIGGKVRGVPVLLLTTTERKSGKKRTMPLAYIMDGNDYVVAASFVGFGRKPGWFHNLMSHPAAAIQVKHIRIAVTARLADEVESQRLWANLLQAEPGYQRFAAHSKEAIPIFVLRPSSMPNRDSGLTEHCTSISFGHKIIVIRLEERFGGTLKGVDRRGF
jgi:deazaflavin-dependent oxidoreductase (nitroreductase family)